LQFIKKNNKKSKKLNSAREVRVCGIYLLVRRKTYIDILYIIIYIYI